MAFQPICPDLGRFTVVRYIDFITQRDIGSATLASWVSQSDGRARETCIADRHSQAFVYLYIPPALLVIIALVLSLTASSASRPRPASQPSG